MAKILIADDDVILTEILRFRLEAAQHDVVVAADGMEALVMAETEEPDLIVLDYMMPVVAGPEVLARLRAEPRTAKIPVVMLSARDGEKDIVSALKAGASDYMTKPFIPHELLVRTEKILLATQ